MKLVKIIAVIFILVTSNTSLAIMPDSIDLWAHEGVTKGHTIRRHVGKSKVYILGKMKPKIHFKTIGTAPMIRTTFLNYKEAQKYIDQTMNSNISKIAQWISNSEESRLVVKSSFGHAGTGSIGRIAYRKQWFKSSGPAPIYWGKGDGVLVVLIRSSSMPFGYYILTAYPTFSKSPVPVDMQTQNK